MIIASRRGHTKASQGASALINEVDEATKVFNEFKKIMIGQGHTFIDCTPSENTTYPNELNFGIDKANRSGAELFVSIHFNKAYNSYNGAIGTEVVVFNKFDTAQRVTDKLVGLGFKARGQKVDQGKGETKRTKMKSMIVEVCFTEATKDVELYKSLGAYKIALAIAEGICNKTIQKPHTGDCDAIHRVSVDGQQIGAYKNHDNVADAVKSNLGKGEVVVK